MGPDGGLLGGRRLVLALAAGGGYGEGTPRHGWDHRTPWLRHAFETLGITDVEVFSTELTLARESPQMIPLDLGAAEDRSLAEAEMAIDAAFTPA
jgi:FMN-dependent NADH-azoreductase